jgi:predicted lactoylglutathione lyase
MQSRVTLVTLGYTNFDRAVRFYEALGWVGSSPDGDVYFMQAGTMVLALWDRKKLAADSTMVDSGGWGGISLAHNVASPAEVDVVLAEAKAAGATIGRPGAPTEWGGYSGIFVDTEGHPWEVAYNPFWTLEADGALRLP